MVRWILLLALLVQFSPAGSVMPARAAASDTGVVRAVLFYSPSCGHCYIVITEVLPTLFEQYGTQLEIIGVDISNQDGQALFMSALNYFHLESGGVPLLVVGDTFMMGSIDIPEQFPGLIEQYLAQGGVDWPALPGLAQAMAGAQAAEAEAAENPVVEEPAGGEVEAAVSLQTPAEEVPPPASLQELVLGRIRQDPVGNTLSIIVLAGMLASIAGAAWFYQRSPGTQHSLRQSWAWLIPALCLLGMVVAGYLTFVETTHTSAVCGPVGDCNTVQQSEYARLFGFLPVGLLGLVGYVLILCAWGVGRFASGRQAHLGGLALFGLAAFGQLFSIYLTFLEPFVIGATCAWCLTSAVIMTLLVWLSIAPLRQAVEYFLQPKLSGA